MTDTSLFPSGLTTRPARQDDLRAVTELLRGSELVDRGEAEITPEDVASVWSMPDFDLDKESNMIFDDDRLVGYGEVYQWRAEATVHPDARDRGIGTGLVAWTEQATLARRSASEEARIGQTIIDSNHTAIELLKRNGYTRRHTSWALRMPTEVEIEDQPLPVGYAIRPFGEKDERQVFQVVEDAFNEWPNRAPSTFEKWQSWVTMRDDFDPSLVFVAIHEEEVVGASVGLPYPDEGWVHQLAVQRDHRRKGLAKALLKTTFDQMRTLGFPEVGLSTDSRTGALDLYLDLGMEVRESYTHYSKLLRPAAIAQEADG
ncbi:MAG: GNAT family N-acetyltransferase [Actinobacteria bacterium]|nr:GNAT family N-acetyltransferase [Actinomycetota bacterium]